MTKPADPAQSAARLDLAPGYLLILAAPIAVYVLLESMLKTFGDAGFTLPASVHAEPAQMIELTGRYKFLAAHIFFGAASVSILLIFALDLAANYTRRAVILAVGGIAVGAAFGIVLSVLEPASLGGFETYHLLGRDFFEAALGVGVTGYCADGPSCLDKTAMSAFRVLTDPINTLTSFSAAAALTGMILSLGQPGGSAADGPEIRAKRLIEAQVLAQRYLYCAGLLLTGGITFLMSWMYWPANLIADELVQKHYKELVGAMTLYVGVGYSMMILSCYLPVMLAHYRRLATLKGELAMAPGAPEPELPQFNPVKSLNAIVAILSPILASAIGSFGQGILFQ